VTSLKGIFAGILSFLIGLTSPRAEVIAEWNFNSAVPDANTSTGTLVPSRGTGSAMLVGGTTGSFAAGDTAQGHDPTGGTDNSAWLTTHYPAASASNKCSGVQFSVDTSGYENIGLSWFQRNSGTASRYARLQYTMDGRSFNDAGVIAVTADGVFTNITFDSSGVSGVSDNPRFAFRIVTEFENTATGVGEESYVATKSGSSYSVNGTLRFDMVTVSGTLVAGTNTAPKLSAIPNQVVRVGQTVGPLGLNVWDAEDAPELLRLAVACSDPAVIPEANIVLGGWGADRTVTITAADRPGNPVVTLSVTDTAGRSTRTSFTVTVVPANTAPLISAISRADTVKDKPTEPIAFTIGDWESESESLGVLVRSGNPELVPNDSDHIILGGSGSNRTVTVNPAPGQIGVAPMTVTVSDGTNTADCVFPVMVSPSLSVILYDGFDYEGGSLLTNSGFLWGNRSGTLGECQVVNGQLRLSANQTEDVVALLAGGPYGKGKGTVLYASFKARLLSLPRSTPGYFAHFTDGSVARGRIWAAVSWALPGCFRLFVSNGGGTNTMLNANLSTNATYTVVTRYDIERATTTLWVNPVAESGPRVTAADVQTAVPISGYGFRQDADIGATILVDELRVGLSFESVVAALQREAPLLRIERAGGNVILRWSGSGSVLQAAANASGPFADVAGASSPFVAPSSASARFFRVRVN